MMLFLILATSSFDEMISLSAPSRKLEVSMMNVLTVFSVYGTRCPSSRDPPWMGGAVVIVVVCLFTFGVSVG